MSKTIEGKELLTIPETAETLQVHHNTIRSWIHEGRLPAKRIGRSLYIAREAIQEIVKDTGASFHK
jgi:excisionase family DNA binding protein